MGSHVKRLSTIGLGAALFLVCLGLPTQGQDFWSPRHVVLDTYTEPVPFPCDGHTLLAYELHITNMDRLPIRLASIDVLADNATVPIESYATDKLAASLNRIRMAGQADTVTEVMGGQRAILHVLLSYDSQAPLPERLTHRIRYAFVKHDGSEVDATIEGGAIRVAREREAVTIGAPLGDGIWLAARSVSEGLSGHRAGAIRPQNGIPYQKGRYAIDWAGLDSTGVAYHGSMVKNEDWVGYGAEVLAVADGRVVMVQDGLPDSQPFDPNVLDNLTGQTLGGNEIVVDIGNDLFAFYGHLQPGSINVKEGDQVRQGQLLGLLGNSGNSTAPHLHFQINRAIPIRGEAVPFVFEDYAYLGEGGSNWGFNPTAQWQEMVDGMIAGLKIGTAEVPRQEPVAVDAMVTASIRNSMMRNAPRTPTPDWVSVLREGGQRRTREMPGSGAVISFGH